VSDPTGPAGGTAEDFPLFAFVEALTALPSLSDTTGRSALVRLLRPAIAARVRHDARARIHLFDLVMTCLEHENGLRELLAAAHFVEGDSFPMRRAVRAAAPLAESRGKIGGDHGG
jgi:Effector-associated domain 2